MDFQFLHDPYNKQWVILSPHRATRPDELSGFTRPCPFCPEFVIPSDPAQRGQSRDPLMTCKVVDNKFPFAPIHKIIIHSPDHKKNFDTLPLGQTELIFQTYQEQYNLYKEKGNVVIFHNYGSEAGASVIHPHSQMVVIPKYISLDVPVVPFVDQASSAFVISRSETTRDPHGISHPNLIGVRNDNIMGIGSFFLLCPQTSQWPDEVWIIPHSAGHSTVSSDRIGSGQANQTFGDLSKEQLRELSHIVARVIQLLDLRHGNDFSFNFYIAPWQNWYLRIIPRLKKPGGFELATGVYVNTQDPKETLAFLAEHYHAASGSINQKHKAKYYRGV